MDIVRIRDQELWRIAMKTIVTGAAGFIGSNLIRALLAQGRTVVAIDNISRGSADNLANLGIDIQKVDLRDYQSTKKALTDADSIYHLAARVGSIDYLHAGQHSEFETLQSNLAIDVNVIRACHENEIRNIIYASSVSVYPISLQQQMGAVFKEPNLEPISPEGGYGWAKLLGEIQLGLLDSCHSAAARIFNAYGEYSEFTKTAQVVPALVRKAINYPTEEFVVWGDGTATRNLVYIADCVEALIKMEQNVSYPPLVLNIGNPQITTIQKLAETVIKVSEKKIPLKFDLKKPVGPMSRIPDITNATQKLGWRPKTSLEDGVRNLYQWMEHKLTN
jgi:GDP-D-mannose 3', 5'-epimerase